VIKLFTLFNERNGDAAEENRFMISITPTPIEKAGLYEIDFRCFETTMFYTLQILLV